MTIMKKAGLGVVSAAALVVLWGRVKAAQPASSGLPAPAPLFELMQVQIAGASAEMAADGASGKKNSSGVRGFAEPASLMAPPRRAVQGMPAKIARTAAVQLEVPSHGRARAQAIGAALKLGAQVSQDDAYESAGCKTGTLAFRVPPEKLDALVRELEPIGRVLHRSVSMQNLTEEYVDLQSRLSNMRRVEKRLSDLLAFKTSKLADVLQVERELERVGADIERLLGRMKYIDAVAAESTLTLTLQEPSRETSRAPGTFGRIADSIVRAWNTFLTTGLALLDLTGFLIAVGLWTAPVGVLVWLARRRLAVKREG